MEVAIGLLIIALCRIIFLERKKKEHLNSINEYKNLYQSSLIEKESVQAQSNKYVEEMAKLQNELDSVKQTSVSLRNEKDKLQIKLNEWKNHYQSLLTEKNAVQSQAKKYLEEISKLIKALEETDKKLKFYQNIEEDSGKLNVSQDLQEREILLKEAKKQLEIARNEQEKTNTNYIDNKQKNKLLDSEQYSILNEIEQSNENFFITGRAGTGKSFLLDVFKMTTQKSNIVSAPTGVAALNVNGQTIHSVFGYDNLVKLDVNSISSQTIRLKSEKKLILKNVTTIIIDEISMVRADTFDKIDRILKAVNHNNLPFGGKQILLFGDLFQLPPVTKTKEEHDYLNDKYGGTLFFCSKAYKQGNFNFRELTINHRQKDDKVYFELLNRVRDGSMTIEDINLLNSRVEQDSSVYDRFTTILPNKDEVEKLNQYRINQLDTPEYTYEAKIILDKRANKTSELSDSFPFSSTLHLKKGALIMMVVNDPEHRWVNGT
ncbi:MAG: AAA family ATPase, partial [Clostridia bacterium]|nr:AAA family ATPase [Clostridia bacterium]